MVRLLAYSSVAQSGYFLLGIVAIGTSSLALPSLILFAAAYVAMNIGAFAIVLGAGRNLDDLTGLGRRSPLRGVAMVIFLLSLTGIPPLFGFVGKFYLLGAAIEAGFLWLAIIGILNSVLALAVYLRMIVPMYREPTQTSPTAPPANLPLAVVLIATATITILMGAFAGLLPV